MEEVKSKKSFKDFCKEKKSMLYKSTGLLALNTSMMMAMTNIGMAADNSLQANVNNITTVVTSILKGVAQGIGAVSLVWCAIVLISPLSKPKTVETVLDKLKWIVGGGLLLIFAPIILDWIFTLKTV